jgi:hypothetical protein
VAGAWGGITFRSSTLENEISYAIVEYGGEVDGASAAIVLSYDQQVARLKLSNTQVRNNAKFGMTVYSGATLDLFANNTIATNASGAIRVEAPSVHQLAGEGNSLVGNGNGNIVRIETAGDMPLVDADVTWPNLSPAIYRITDTSGVDGEQIYVNRHLTIEAGAIFEFVGGSGINVDGGTAGLSAIGTTSAPIVFRGVDSSGWTGIGIFETSWTGNALENVQIENAAGPPYNSVFYVSSWKGAIAIGQIKPENAAVLRVKNLTVKGPNTCVNDLVVNSPSVLTQQGTNHGTDSDGTLLIQVLN